MKKFLLISLAALAAATVFSCRTVHQFPEPGKEIDPTEIETNIVVTPRVGFEDSTVITKSGIAIDLTQEDTSKYDRRYFVQIRNNEFNNDTVATWQVIRPSSDTSSFTKTIKLHARKYKVAVWMDYVLKGSEKDLYFTTGNGEELEAIGVLSREKYVAGSDFKDGQHFMTELDFTPYAGQWHTSITVPAKLQSKMAKIRFLANDLKKYAESIEWKESLDSLAKIMRIEFNYSGYFPTGLNAWTGRLNNADVGYGFKHYAYHPSEFTGNEYTLVGSDFVFVNGESSSVTISAVINTKDGAFVNEISNMTIPIKRGQETIVVFKFFTKEYVPGIGINPEFDGEFNIYV